MTTEQMRESLFALLYSFADNVTDRDGMVDPIDSSEFRENAEDVVAYIEALLSQDRQRFKVEMENKYENCPQCTGLRDEYKANLKKAIEGMKPVLTKKVGGLEGYREEQLINKAHILALLD